MRTLTLLLILSFLCSCGAQQPSSDNTSAQSATQSKQIERMKGNSIYFWKTTFRLNDAELEFLKRHNIRRLYVRFFDVALDGEGSDIKWDVIPIATTKFVDTIPSGVDIVPTVYITLDALRNIEGQEEDYAEKIVT